MSLPVLIGSQALSLHKRLMGRNAADWDFIIEGEKSLVKKNNITFDLISANCSIDSTNRFIFDYCQRFGSIVETPLGLALLAPLEILKLLKIASSPLNKIKHDLDLKTLEDINLDESLIKICEMRLTDTKNKIKKEFFDKYHVPRFIEHDELHLYINPTPTYLKLLKENNPTEICPIKFDNSDVEIKKLVLWEECLILSLERSLIPRIRSAPAFVEAIVERFLEVNKSTDPSLSWLMKLSTPGKVKDHPDFISLWAKNNFEFLLKDYEIWWKSKVHSLPKEFWLKLLKF